jgi:hypothetical protein
MPADKWLNQQIRQVSMSHNSEAQIFSRVFGADRTPVERKTANEEGEKLFIVGQTKVGEDAVVG